MIETIRKKLKITYFSESYAKYENDINNTWKSINEVIGNTKNT